MKNNIASIFDMAKCPGLTRTQDRILAEVKFAYLLTQHTGKDGELAEKAAAAACAGFEKGCTGEALLAEVEGILMPLSAAAKEYKVICPAHAHIDMNWQWAYDETVTTTIDTFKTMLDILDEYPEYKFSQSQASVYEIVEEYAPEMLEKIKKYVKEGRWEVTASTWVEADKNMPTGESFARHTLYTKEYLCSMFGLEPDYLNIDFEPDTFGHSANIPEISAKSGVKYYYHCRGNDGGDYLYRWRSPSGAELMVYREPFFYNSDIGTYMADSIIDLSVKTGSKTLLKVYGVGDHGGGPTRKDVERILEMNKWPVFPTIVCGTFHEYFAEMEKIRDTLPVLEEEINFICDGCYSSQSRITAGNINGERDLKQAEAISAFSSVFAGGNSMKETYKKAWKRILFNQFHDILTGSGKIMTREYACGQYQKVQAAVKSGRKLSMQNICANINTSEVDAPDCSDNRSGGAGSGSTQPENGRGLVRFYHAFNASSVDFFGNVEVVVWDYQGKIDCLKFKTDKSECRSQIIEKGGYWGHTFTRFIVEAAVPQFGYETLIAYPEEKINIDFHYVNEMRRQHEEVFILENQYVKAVIDDRSGAIVSLMDKASGKELIDSSRGGAGLCLIDEANAKSITFWNESMSSWFVGRHKNIITVDNIELVPGVTGELRNSFKYKAKIRDSFVNVEISLDAQSRELDIAVQCDWREFGDSNSRIPSLAFTAPVAYQAESYKYDVPFGILNRKSMNIDRPANSFVVANAEEGSSLMLETDSKYGYRGYDDSICVKLLRSSTDPDPVPEICVHDMRISIGVSDEKCDSCIQSRAMAKYAAVQVYSGSSQSGKLPMGASFLKAEGCVVSSVKAAEDGGNGFAVRVYNPCEKAENVKLSFACEVKEAYLADTLENKKAGETLVNGKAVEFAVKPYEVETIIVKL